MQAAEASLKRSTVRSYRDNLENHVYPMLGTQPITQVTRTHVKLPLTALTGKGLQPKTVTGVLAP